MLVLFRIGDDGRESNLEGVEQSSRSDAMGLSGTARRLVDPLTSASNSLRQLALQSGVSTCSTVFRFSSSILYASSALL